MWLCTGRQTDACPPCHFEPVEKSQANGSSQLAKGSQLLRLHPRQQVTPAVLGVTNDLEARIWQHKTKATTGHAARYNIDRLVYMEEFGDITQAIDREKQLKKWRREKKVALVEGLNPTWRDLAVGWYEGVFVPGEE